MATMNVKDAAGSVVAIEKPLAPGRAAAASSRPVALSSEDFAVIDGLETLITSTNTKLDTLAGYLDGLEALIGTTNSNIAAATLGTTAHDSVDGNDPLKIGFKAIAGQSSVTLVAAADRTNAYAGLDGVQLTRPHCGLEDIVTGNATNTDGTSTPCIASSGAGVKTYLTSVVLCNTSAVAITVDIKDGSTTKISLPLPAGSGCVFNPPVPIPGTAATAWSFDPSAAATTVTCSMVGFKSKV